jgi:hypothetical protein
MLPGTPLVSARTALTSDCEEKADLAVSDQDAGLYASHKAGDCMRSLRINMISAFFPILSVDFRTPTKIYLAIIFSSVFLQNS